jgi:hypothetical protein
MNTNLLDQTQEPEMMPTTSHMAILIMNTSAINNRLIPNNCYKPTTEINFRLNERSVLESLVARPRFET